MSIRHADLADIGERSVAESGASEALRDWWSRWDALATTVRDQPVSEVLAEERNRD